MSNLSVFFKGFVLSLGISFGFVLVLSVHAAYSALQSVWTTTTWAVLSSSEWNKMVSNFVSVDSQLSSLSSSVAGLGSLASKSAVTSAEITDGTVATADIANSAVTDAKVAAGIAPSKLGSASATSGQVLKWNGSAWAPGSDNSWVTLGRNSCEWIYTNTCGHSCGAGVAYESICPAGKYVAGLGLHTYWQYAPYNFRIYCCTP